MSGRLRSSQLLSQTAGDDWLNRTESQRRKGGLLRTVAADVFETTTSWLVYAIFAPLAVLNSRIVRRLLLAMLIIDIPLQLTTHLDFQQDAAAVGSLGGFDISLTTIALVGLFVSWWTGSLVAPYHRVVSPVHISYWPIFYIVFVAMSTLVARDFTLSLFELFLLCQMFLLYIYILSNANSREDVMFALSVLILGLALESLFIIGMAFVGQKALVIHLSRHSLVGEGVRSHRIAGTVGSPNLAAGYLSMLLAPAVSVLFTDLGRWYKRLAMLTFGVGVVGLILTGSRGGWMAFAVAIMTVCVFMLRGKRLWLGVAIAGNFLLIIGLVFQDVITARYGQAGMASAAARLPLIKLAWQIIKDHPLLGAGANNFTTVAKDYVSHNRIWPEWFFTVHNKYLLVWAETGIGGLFAFLGFLMVTMRQLWKCWKCHDRLLSPLALGFMAGILGMMAHMLVDVYRGRAVVQAFWLIAALAAIMQRSAMQNTSGRVSIVEEI
jgi:putative inorganic carbon (HCO3(-)) transporter